MEEGDVTIHLVRICTNAFECCTNGERIASRIRQWFYLLIFINIYHLSRVATRNRNYRRFQPYGQQYHFVYNFRVEFGQSKGAPKVGKWQSWSEQINRSAVEKCIILVSQICCWTQRRSTAISLPSSGLDIRRLADLTPQISGTHLEV